MEFFILLAIVFTYIGVMMFKKGINDEKNYEMEVTKKYKGI